MFGNHLPTLTVAGVMTLLAFPAGAVSHSWMSVDVVNNSEFPVTELCVLTTDGAVGFGRPDVSSVCFGDLDWAIGTRHSFTVPCEPDILKRFSWQFTFTYLNGDTTRQSESGYACHTAGLIFSVL